MEEFTQLTKEDVKDIINNFPIEPRYNKMIVTLNMFEEGGVVFHDEGVSETQYVIAKGSRVDYDAGDKVFIDLRRLAKKIPSETDSTQLTTVLDIHPIEVDGITFAWLDDSYILGKDNRK